jgi:hypothetical protein
MRMFRELTIAVVTASTVLLMAVPAQAATHKTDPKGLVITLHDVGKKFSLDQQEYDKKIPKKLKKHGLVKEYERQFEAKRDSNPTLTIVAAASSFKSLKDASWALGYIPTAAAKQAGHFHLHKTTEKRYDSASVAYKVSGKIDGTDFRGLLVGMRHKSYVGLILAGGFKEVFKAKDALPVVQAQANRLKAGK